LGVVKVTAIAIPSHVAEIPPTSYSLNFGQAMASASETLVLNTSFEPEAGKLVNIVEGIGRVTAPNRGPYTFTGTNSFLIGVDRLVVIDPGPRDSRHLKALLAAIGGRPVEAILLTHTHQDHAGLARKLRAKTRAPLWFAGPHRLYRPVGWLEQRTLSQSCDFSLVPDAILADGDSLKVDGITLTAMTTPGHCANHLAFSVSGAPYLLTGDHIMGWSSTLVAPPDGSMGDYLQSLEKVIVAPFSYYLPAHGGPISEGRKYARALLAHRLRRDAQILEGIDDGANTIGRLVRHIYKDIAPALRPAAAKTIEAHLDHLVEQSRIEAQPAPFGLRYGRVSPQPV
jgi:glyoxylase-like metal-dependent hydrolase (beta-lactamase superfamily II)